MSVGTDTTDVFPAHADISFLGLAGDESDFLAGQGWSVSDAVSRTKHSDSTDLQHNSNAFSPFTQQRPPRLNIPNFLGALGELQRVDGSTDSWRWVIGELRRCPRDLATRGETLFLHKDLYRDAMPSAIRAALGTSAAFCMLDEDRRHLLFSALDAEVSELTRTPLPMGTDEGLGHGCTGVMSTSSGGLTLIEELARLQAFTLYQMMRMYGGGLEQRVVVQQQRGLLMTWALQLLMRSRAELGGDGDRASDAGDHIHCWDTWILAESIRRTVLVVYMFYGMYSLATEGFCNEIPTLAKLPVSATPSLWHSEDAYLAQSRSGEAPKTMTYEDFTYYWMVSPPARLDPFEKFLVIPCKGFEGIIS